MSNYPACRSCGKLTFSSFYYCRNCFIRRENEQYRTAKTIDWLNFSGPAEDCIEDQPFDVKQEWETRHE